MNPWAWLADVGPALADTATAAWALPSPLDVLAIAALWLLRVTLWVPVTATQNLAGWGPFWPVGFWMLFGVLWSIGTVGLETDAKVFAGGEDVSAYSGGRASWLGFAARVTRTRVKLRAQTAATQIIVGRVAPAGMLTVAVMWAWLFVVAVAVGWVAWWWSQPRPWDATQEGPD